MSLRIRQRKACSIAGGLIICDRSLLNGAPSELGFALTILTYIDALGVSVAVDIGRAENRAGVVSDMLGFAFPGC